MRLKPQTYALTVLTSQRRRVFQRTTIAELFIETLFRYRDARKFQLHAFAIMPDHAHILLTPDQAIERAVQLIKGGFSFAVRKDFPGEIWQSGYHAHRIVDEQDLHNQTAYIANNPTRKRYAAYPHVHTTESYAGRIDPPPAFLLSSA